MHLLTGIRQENDRGEPPHSVPVFLTACARREFFGKIVLTSPQLIAVDSFEEARNHLTAEAAVLDACRRSVDAQWLGQWSKIIDGAKVH